MNIFDCINKGDTVRLKSGEELTFKAPIDNERFTVEESDRTYHIDVVKEIERRNEKEALNDEAVGGGYIKITLNEFEGKLGIGIERRCVSTPSQDLMILDALINVMIHKKIDWSNPMEILKFGAIMKLGCGIYED